MHGHGETPQPADCDACLAEWIALRGGTVSPPEPEVVDLRQRPDLDGNVERPRGVEGLY